MSFINDIIEIISIMNIANVNNITVYEQLFSSYDRQVQGTRKEII